MIEPGRLWGGHDSEPDVQVEFEKGKIVFVSAWEEAFSHYTIELLSPSGRLRYEEEGKMIIWQSVCSDQKIAGYQILQREPELIGNNMEGYQWSVVSQLANALAEKPHTLSTGRQSLATLEAMHKIINQR
jgi:hypothetical protein